MSYNCKLGRVTWPALATSGSLWKSKEQSRGHLVSSKKCYGSSLCRLSLCDCDHRGSHGTRTMVSVLVQFWDEDPTLGAALNTSISTWLRGQRDTKGDLDFFLGLKPCCLWALSHHTLFQGPKGSVSRCRETQKETTYIRKTEVGTAWYVGFQLLCLGKDKHTQLFVHTMEELEKEMATHCSILAWKIPWTEEPGRLQSMGSQRDGHDWVTKPLWKSSYWWSTV